MKDEFTASVKTTTTGSVTDTSYILFGDQDAGTTRSHKERWDDVFFTNEVPEPATVTLICLGATALLVRKRRA